MKIDREKIVAEAVRLLDEKGLDGLTTRALAQRLGVKQPALYWHFANRRELLLAMNDTILRDFYPKDQLQPDQGWQDYLIQTAHAFRHALLAHRDGARLHAGTPANDMLLERQIQILVAAGLPAGLAIRLLVALGRFVVGWVLEEQAGMPGAPQSAPMPGGPVAEALHDFFQAGEEAVFDTGLRFLVSGAAALVLETDANRPQS